MSALLPCPACQRHVRVADVACPFCDAEIEAREAPAASPVASTSRARIMGYGLGAAMVVTAAVSGGCISAYGAPAPEPDAGAAMEDAGVDSGAPVSAYGTPAP